MSKQIQDAYIVAATRTAVGKAPRGMFRNTRPDDLLAHTIRAVVKETGVDPAMIDDAIIGCAMPEGEQGMNMARIAVLLAGLPNTVSAMTINRFCSSGSQAVGLAADRIRLGEADLMLAGGAESMSMVPMMGSKPAFNPNVFKDDNYAIAYGMGITAEKVAERWNVSREDQDQFSYQSHMKALKAIEAGEFNDEIAAFALEDRYPDLNSGQIIVDSRSLRTDEGPRKDTSVEGLAKLKPAFRSTGSVTAGNSSQMSDGAASVLLASERAIKQFNLKPLGRWVGHCVAGVPPEVMGIGPKEAIPKLLKQTGVKLDDIDWIELNEAFAAQALAVIRDSGLNPERVNPLGGAIALGHPLGATGAIRTATIVHALKRRQQRYGMVSMCIGTGMGFAGLIERV
jgi:acetyl-CoA acyltransferase